MRIPPLPVRAKMNGERRLCYPTGVIHGTWALPEILYAESIGCEVEVYQALVFEREEVLLADYMETLIAARLKFGKASREGEWLKLVANSLYGKLASKPEHSTIIFNPDPRTLMAVCVKCGDEPCSHLVKIHGRLNVYEKTEEKIPECGHIVWAAYITARGRIQLHKALTECGSDDALYCDTDSVFTTTQRDYQSGSDSGNLRKEALGGWAFKGEFTDFEGIAPKVYSYVKSDGIRKVKAKGITMPGDIDAAWNSIRRGERVSSPHRPCGFRSAIHRGRIFSNGGTGRQVSGSYGDRIAILGGDSRPPRMEELDLDIA
jgi:hypothetical protein